MKKGFTLIELLVVVLIIGILAAIALPQYQKAVLKSRYSGLMPIANAVANAQEIYYMDHGRYSTDITRLDIKVPSSGANAEIEVNNGEDARFDYVLTTRTDAPGVAYVMYQKHSEQFPDAIMCEANDTLNSQATWLCHESLKGKEVASGSLLGEGWTAYLLKGVESGRLFEEPSECTGDAPTITASKSGATSTAECVNGEWKFVTWENGQTYSGAAPRYFPNTPYAYGGSVFHHSAFCWGSVEKSCAGASFINGGYCGGSDGACADSIFTNGGFCYGFGGSHACEGAIFRDGGYCYESHAGSSCFGALIQDGAYCEGLDCDKAIYSGTGCCKGSSCGNAPRCQ